MDPSDDRVEGTQAAPDAGPESNVPVVDVEPPAGPVDVTPPIDRPPVDVVVGECQGFTPCGGDLDGVWTYTAACVDPADLGVSEAQLALCPGANVTLSGEVSGTLSFADGRMTRRGESMARGQIAVPALCALLLGGCGAVTRELVNAGLSGATCSSGRGLLPSCSCRFTLVAPAIEDVAFETSGAVLRTSDGRSYEYCVEADALSYAEVGAAREPGERRLSR